jgi:hypothetical protein
VISVVMVVATSLAAAAPAAGGLLLDAWGAPVAVLCFAGAVVVSAAASALI